MGERKVLNKYIDPEFDPAKLPRGLKPKNAQVSVRLMLPMSVQCAACGEYIHKGKKFNGRKEEVKGEDYLGIKIWRFYLRCTNCLAEITFKTDPARSDYVVERGASRNFEPWKQRNAEAEFERAKKEREEMGDSMKVLENRTEASKREMDLQDAIEEVRELNARAAALTTDQVIDIHSGAAARWEEAQIEEMAAQAFAHKQNGGAARTNGAKATPAMPDSFPLDPDDAAIPPASSPSAPMLVKRLPDAIDLAAADFRPAAAAALDQLEVPDSPTGGARAADLDPAATGAAAGSSSAAAISSNAAAAAAVSSSSAAGVSSSIPAASPSSSFGASLAAPAPLAGLVLLKKRKGGGADGGGGGGGGTEDSEKEKKKKAKKEKKAAAAAAAAAANSNQTSLTATAAPAEPPATGGLGGLLGNYDDDDE